MAAKPKPEEPKEEEKPDPLQAEIDRLTAENRKHRPGSPQFRGKTWIAKQAAENVAAAQAAPST